MSAMLTFINTREQSENNRTGLILLLLLIMWARGFSEAHILKLCAVCVCVCVCLESLVMYIYGSLTNTFASIFLRCNF